MSVCVDKRVSVFSHQLSFDVIFSIQDFIFMNCIPKPGNKFIKNWSSINTLLLQTNVNLCCPLVAKQTHCIYTFRFPYTSKTSTFWRWMKPFIHNLSTTMWDIHIFTSSLPRWGYQHMTAAQDPAAAVMWPACRQTVQRKLWSTVLSACHDITLPQNPSFDRGADRADTLLIKHDHALLISWAWRDPFDKMIIGPGCDLIFKFDDFWTFSPCISGIKTIILIFEYVQRTRINK